MQKSDLFALYRPFSMFLHVEFIKVSLAVKSAMGSSEFHVIDGNSVVPWSVTAACSSEMPRFQFQLQFWLFCACLGTLFLRARNKKLNAFSQN